MWAHQPSPEGSQQLYWVLKVMAGTAKSTTTPNHKTTFYTVGLTKGFHSPHRKPPGKRPNPTADQPHEQCSHPPPPCLRAKWSKRELPRVSKPDRKTVVPNYSDTETVHSVMCLFTSQFSPVLIAHTHGRMARLSESGWRVTYRDGLPAPSKY